MTFEYIVQKEPIRKCYFMYSRNHDFLIQPQENINCTKILSGKWSQVIPLFILIPSSVLLFIIIFYLSFFLYQYKFSQSFILRGCWNNSSYQKRPSSYMVIELGRNLVTSVLKEVRFFLRFKKFNSNSFLFL